MNVVNQLTRRRQQCPSPETSLDDNEQNPQPRTRAARRTAPRSPARVENYQQHEYTKHAATHKARFIVARPARSSGRHSPKLTLRERCGRERERRGQHSTKAGRAQRPRSTNAPRRRPRRLWPRARASGPGHRALRAPLRDVALLRALRDVPRRADARAASAAAAAAAGGDVLRPGARAGAGDRGAGAGEFQSF